MNHSTIIDTLGLKVRIQIHNQSLWLGFVCPTGKRLTSDRPNTLSASPCNVTAFIHHSAVPEVIPTCQKNL